MRSATLVCVLTATVICTLSGGASAADKQHISVLYAGASGSQRESAFLEFLRQHFTRVGSADAASFSPAAAEGYQVVILDWKPLYANGKYLGGLPTVDLPDDYDRATIMIGGLGGNIGGREKLLLDWL